MHVLIVEDEPTLAGLLRQALTEDGYQVVVAHDGLSGLEFARMSQFELLILDLTLPGMDGVEVARTLRAEGNRIPILMLTARDADEDMIRGLDTGADDYVTKPFSFDVVLSRLRAIARRGPVALPVCHRLGDLVIDTATRQVTRGRRPVSLTDREYRLLLLLARRPRHVFSRSTIIDAVWGFNSDISGNNLEAFVHLLRSKLEHPGEAKLIRTVRGVGYTLQAEEA
jgi:DNA-binding response OmpR family regulator